MGRAMARIPTTGRLWLDWIIVGAVAIAVSVVIAWQFDVWFGFVPFVLVLPLIWRRGGERDGG
jgi:hypothetical protein